MSKTSSIPDLLRAGLTPTAIAKQLEISRTTVYNVKNKLKIFGSIHRRPGSGSKRAARTPSLINKVKRRIQSNPSRSLRKMALELKTSLTTVRRIVKNDLKMKSRAKVKVPLLTEKQKASRKERAQALLNNLKHAQANRTIFFTDEKNFTVDAVANRRNDRWIGDDPRIIPDNVKYVNSTKNPASAMMFGLVASDGQKMPPVYIPSGVKVNTETYIEILNSKVKPWINLHYPDGNYVFQQDGAPPHTSKKTQAWLKDHLVAFFPKDMWPPQSPDLNPLDYSVWATVEKDACSKSHPSISALKKSITRSWNKMTTTYIQKTCKSFRSRLEAVIAANGGHIEK